MTLVQLSEMFNRSFAHVFERKKFIFMFCMLTLAGMCILFFKGIALMAGGWWKTGLDFFPLFIALGFVLAAEVILIRLYVAEKEGSAPQFRRTVVESWELCFRVSYLSLPLLLLYLMCWLLSGLFLLIESVPIFGTFLAVILSFAPFVLNLASLLLVVAALFIAFYVCPQLVLGTRKRRQLFQKLRQEPFFVLLYFLIDLAPVWIVYKLLSYAAGWTLTFEMNSLEKILQSFVIMLPYLVVLTPILIFFFNFASEVFFVLGTGRETEGEYSGYRS